MAYFKMQESNNINDFYRVRIEELKQIEFVNYGDNQDIVIFVNHMQYAKYPNNKESIKIFQEFIKEVENYVENGVKLIDIDAIFIDKIRKNY